jgi:Helix-turn-helix domain
MSIGEALAQARHRAGLTVTQVSRLTRIRETIIRDIEDDDYSACGGDFYARGHIRSIAKAAGADPEPLIREYDSARQEPHEMTLADIVPGMSAVPGTPAAPGTSATPVMTRERRRLNQAVALALALLVALGFGIYDVVSGPRQATSAAPAARMHAMTHHRPAPDQPAHAAAPAHPTVQPRMLVPVSAMAFGPHRGQHGDNPQLAPAAIDRNPVTAWHTDWYTTARFGNIYRGSGLLLDMGRPVVVTRAWITLGSPHGAGFQLRAGPAPALAHLKAVARVAFARGVVPIRLASPAHGRYLLIWFTRLPQHRSGTFWASVHDVRLEGRPLRAGS